METNNEEQFVEFDEILNFIHENTGFDKEVIEKVLDAETPPPNKQQEKKYEKGKLLAVMLIILFQTHTCQSYIRSFSLPYILI